MSIFDLNDIDRPRYFSKEGKPITIEDMLDLESGDDDYRRVGIWVNWCGEEMVSTVWLGIDHSWHNDTKPTIFETLVQYSGDKEDEIVERYKTLEEAIQGHRKWVESRGGNPDDPPPDWYLEERIARKLEE